jgi:hypothetical protein
MAAGVANEGGMKLGRELRPAACGALLLLSSCADSEERYDVGYDDGYAVGYNTACRIRATLIEGDFDNTDYARGYAEGQSAGIVACNKDRQAGQ